MTAVLLSIERLDMTSHSSSCVSLHLMDAFLNGTFLVSYLTATLLKSNSQTLA